MQDSQENIVQRALVSLLLPVVVTASNDAYDRERKTHLRPRGVDSGQVVSTLVHTPPRRLSVIDRPSSQALTVLWSDACFGHYGHQTWRRGYAKRDALCVLSGAPISKGDEVYRPRANRDSLPANWDRMILASKVGF
ncbi:DUF3331 domain-containing protein [Paraburkholderia youngii]|uniref:DUF3331 domain-containing protein n=1 Tax=Paraburkholderia youngii TaxID=2782701 RepID=UPI003D262664